MSPLLLHAHSTPPSCPLFMLHQLKTQPWRITLKTYPFWIQEQRIASCHSPGWVQRSVKKQKGFTSRWPQAPARALLYNNVIYAKIVTRPLFSVDQLKGTLDLRMIWDDSSPLIVVYYAGKSKCCFKPMLCITSHWGLERS